MVATNSPEFIILIAITALLVGFSKGGLGGPAPVTFTTPLLSLIMPVSLSVSLVQPMLMIGDILALWTYWKEWDMYYIRLMLPISVLGVLSGVLLLSSLPNDILRAMMAIMIIIFVVYKLASDRLKNFNYTHHNWHAYFASFGASFMSTLANAGAPPLAAYFLMQKVTPRVFIGTTTLYFSIVNAMKLPGILLSGLLSVDILLQIAWVIPIIFIGVWVGKYAVIHMDPKWFENMMLVMLIFVALFILFNG